MASLLSSPKKLQSQPVREKILKKWSPTQSNPLKLSNLTQEDITIARYELGLL